MLPIFAATVVVFLLFDTVAAALHSDRGQWGILICAIVVGSLVLIERLAFRQRISQSDVLRGFGRPERAGLTASIILSAALVASLGVVSFATHLELATLPKWQWMLPGLFAQGGLAEESLFRGFLFERLRRDRSFRHAATLSLIPFVLAHLVLFARMPWPIALGAVLLSVAMTYPLARLYELGGRTIWAPAIVHFVVQSALKVTVASGGETVLIPVAWMALSALLPYTVFLWRDGRPQA